MTDKVLDQLEDLGFRCDIIMYPERPRIKRYVKKNYLLDFYLALKVRQANLSNPLMQILQNPSRAMKENLANSCKYCSLQDLQSGLPRKTSPWDTF